MWLCRGSPCSQWKFSRNSIGKTTQSSARLGFVQKFPAEAEFTSFHFQKLQNQQLLKETEILCELLCTCVRAMSASPFSTAS